MKQVLILSACFALLGVVCTGDVTATHLDDVGSTLLAQHNGDVNADGSIDISDPLYLMQYMFLGGPRPVSLSCEPFTDVHNGDVDGSGSIDITDPIVMLNHLFLGGPGFVEGCEDA